MIRGSGSKQERIAEKQLQTEQRRFGDKSIETREPGVNLGLQAGGEAPKILTKEEYDEDRLLGFLRTHLKQFDKAIKEQTVISNNINYWKYADRTVEGTRLVQAINLALSPDSRDTGKFTVNCSRLNSTGLVLVLGLKNNQEKIDGPAKVIAFNLLKTPSKAREAIWSIETTASVSFIEFHPRKPSIIAVGLSSGRIGVYDISRIEAGADPTICYSDVNEFTHSKEISALQWCPFRVESSNKMLLCSCSLDGKIILWDMSLKLSLPKRGYLISRESGSDDLPILLPGRSLLLIN